MAEVIWKSPALNDLNDVAEYIALSNLNYREIIVNPRRIFYKIENDKVYILHVMRQERDLRRFIIQS